MNEESRHVNLNLTDCLNDWREKMEMETSVTSTVPSTGSYIFIGTSKGGSHVIL